MKQLLLHCKCRLVVHPGRSTHLQVTAACGSKADSAKPFRGRVRVLSTLRTRTDLPSPRTLSSISGACRSVRMKEGGPGAIWMEPAMNRILTLARGSGQLAGSVPRI